MIDTKIGRCQKCYPETTRTDENKSASTSKEIYQKEENLNQIRSISVETQSANEETADKNQKKVYSFPYLKLVGMLFFVPTSAMGGNPFGVLIGVVIAIFFYRSWMLAIGETTSFSNNNTLTTYYIKIYFAYSWRALVLILGSTALAGLLLGDAALGGAIGAVLFVQFVFASVFTILIPHKIFKYRR